MVKEQVLEKETASVLSVVGQLILDLYPGISVYLLIFCPNKYFALQSYRAILWKASAEGRQSYLSERFRTQKVESQKCV